MKILKVILALILSFGLLLSQGALMGSIGCGKAISQESITKAVKDTNFTNQLYKEAARTSDQIADEKTQAFLNQALRTDAASEFIGKYAASAIDSVLQGKDTALLTERDLLQLTEDSLDELSAQTGIPISDSQRRLVLNYVNAHGNDLIQEINSTAQDMNSSSATNSSDQELLSRLSVFLSLPFQAALAAVCLILGIFLLVLFWKSKMGFIWWAAVSFIAGSFYFLTGTSSELFTSYIQETGDGTAFSLLLTGMFSQAAVFVGICGLIFTAVLAVLCLISRKIARRAL